MQLFVNLKKPTYALIALGVALLLFDFNYYIMVNFLGEINLTCVIGAALTKKNIVFALLTSTMTGVLISGVVRLFFERKGRQKNAGTASIGIVGTLIGFFTVFCTLCTLPVFVLFGVSIGFGFFTDFTIYFQLLSLGLLSGALFFLNRQLVGVCDFCEVG